MQQNDSLADGYHHQRVANVRLRVREACLAIGESSVRLLTSPLQHYRNAYYMQEEGGAAECSSR